MPRGDKSAYTDKQKEQARHIEEGYERRGRSEKDAQRIAWATVNKISHGGKKSGSGRGRAEDRSVYVEAGKKGGQAAAARPAYLKSAAATKAAATRKRR